MTAPINPETNQPFASKDEYMAYHAKASEGKGTGLLQVSKSLRNSAVKVTYGLEATLDLGFHTVLDARASQLFPDNKDK